MGVTVRVEGFVTEAFVSAVIPTLFSGPSHESLLAKGRYAAADTHPMDGEGLCHNLDVADPVGYEVPNPYISGVQVGWMPEEALHAAGVV
jgi:hypothetical protein